MDADREAQGPSQEELREALDKLLLPAVNISDLDARLENGKFDDLAFELFKETASVLVVCATGYIAHSEQADVSYPRKQAICIGLLVRLVKFMRAILAQLSYGEDLGEVVLALSRCLAETSISVRYLILKQDGAVFDEFVRTGLGPEGALYDWTQQNIARRNGETLPIEQRTLKSIERICRLSEVSIDEVKRKHSDWGGGIKKRLIALEIEEAYVSVQRVPSHAVHGTWTDLLLHHLDEKPGGFAPRFETTPVDSRHLLPICHAFILSAAKDYVKHYLEGMAPLIARITDLDERIVAVDAAHEKW